MCDRRILSSDPHDWDELISEAAGAEKYSRRLSERITDGYAASVPGMRAAVEAFLAPDLDPDTALPRLELAARALWAAFQTTDIAP